MLTISLEPGVEPGEQLKDAEIAEWLGLSRTPIREALARLEEYGLVETAPNRYTRHAPQRWGCPGRLHGRPGVAFPGRLALRAVGRGV